MKSGSVTTARKGIPDPVASLVRVLVVGAVLLGIGFTLSDNAFYMRLATSAVILYVLVGGYNIIFGYAGLFSLAQVAFAGVGGYTCVIIQARFGVNLLVAAIVSVALATLLSILLAWPTARLGGAFFALATLTFAVAVHEVTLKWTEVTGGAQGFLGIQPPEIMGQMLLGGEFNYFALAVVVAVLSFEVFFRISRSGTSRKMVALRESVVATQSVGVSPIKVRVLAFALSGMFAAIAGVLMAYNVLFISPESYSLGLMIEALIVALIGGAGTLLGPVLGVVALVVIDEASAGVGTISLLIFGVAIILILSFAPKGLVGVGSQVKRRFVRTRPTPGPSSEAIRSAAAALPAPSPKEGKSLQAQGITLSFSGVTALEDVSLTVNSGEVVGLIGPNGAGKTSLVNVITGLATPTTGDVRLSGTSLLGMSAHQVSQLGVVRTFQSSKMIPTFDLVTNVMLGCERGNEATTLEQVLHLARSRRDDRRASIRSMQLLDLVGVADHAFERVEDLPYGIVRRAEIARVLATDPDFVLLDEPGAGLSQFEREEVVEAIHAVSRTGAGVLLIDHNVGFVQSVCRRLVVLANGRLLAEGPTDEVLAHSDVVAAYLGEGNRT
jgi:ABC-type branched-subunit amino acid transport system ATPase component/ABC-type branched-subunit amino acid transport system permease subunit